MAKKASTIKDLTAVLAQNLPDEVMSVPGENSIDTAIRILSATIPAEDAAQNDENAERVDSPEAVAADPTKAAFIPSAPVADKLIVDKGLFYQMFSSLVKGHAGRYINVAGMSLISRILGAKTREEEKAEWQKCSDFLSGKAKP